jgi:hypothetical protein
LVKERRSEKELRQMMLTAARNHEECGDLDSYGPTPRLDANWGFGIAGKENKVSVECYTRLDQIASDLQQKYELRRVKISPPEPRSIGSSDRFRRKSSWNSDPHFGARAGGTGSHLSQPRPPQLRRRQGVGWRAGALRYTTEMVEFSSRRLHSIQ